MSFIEEVINDSLPIWKQCANEKFLNEMCDGTLDKQKFFNYIVQDSLYLRDYLKAYAAAICKSTTLKDMQVFYSALGFVNDSENATRLKYLADFGMTDDDVEKVAKLPANEAYTRFEREIAESGGIPEILMAVLPCMLGYYYVFNDVRNRAPQVMDGYFGPLVGDYTSEFYKECCKSWADYADSKCEDSDDVEKARLTAIFREASLHELKFWKMAGEC